MSDEGGGDPDGSTAVHVAAATGARPWSDRARDAGLLPGAPDEALSVARRLVDHVASVEPTRRSFHRWLEHRFDLTPAAARAAADAVRAAGLAAVDGHVWRPTPAGVRWLDGGADELVVIGLHDGVRFVGELLQVTQQTATTAQVLAIANAAYDLGWRTEAPVAARSAWLRSAGLLEEVDGALATTPAGSDLLDRLVLEPPARGADPDAREPVAHLRVVATTSALVRASSDADDPDGFTDAVGDAFRELGFDARLVGTAEDSSLLVRADAGGDGSYRIAVAAVVDGSGMLHDERVDWLDLLDRGRRHETDHCLVVGPPPAEALVIERARSSGASVLAADRLHALLVQHRTAPLGAADYRLLLRRPGEVHLDEVIRLAEERVEREDLAKAVVEAVRTHAAEHGPLSAREVALVLADTSGSDADEDEVQSLLEVLAHPLLGLLTGSIRSGYASAAGAEIASQRLRLLADALAPPTVDLRDL